MNYIIKTSRIGLRNWHRSDLDAMTAINQNPQVMRYFPSRPNRKETEVFILKMQHQFQQNNYCYFAAELLPTAEFIGFVGLSDQNYPADFTPCVDIGWRLKVQAWGKGFATEAATACLEYAFNRLYLKEIFAIAPLVNKPSIRVMEKIDMQPKGTFRHPKLINHPHLTECVVYVKSHPK